MGRRSLTSRIREADENHKYVGTYKSDTDGEGVIRLTQDAKEIRRVSEARRKILGLPGGFLYGYIVKDHSAAGKEHVRVWDYVPPSETVDPSKVYRITTPENGNRLRLHSKIAPPRGKLEIKGKGPYFEIHWRRRSKR